MGAGGAVGLNYLAFERIALAAGVEQDELLDFYAKVRLISSVLLDLQYKDAEEERKKKK